jgi:uncharacterized membrane protein
MRPMFSPYDVPFPGVRQGSSQLDKRPESRKITLSCSQLSADSQRFQVPKSANSVNPHTKEKSMSTVVTSIEVNVPVRAAYNQWTHFEEFPRFMDGIQEVHQLGDRRLHWKAEIGGREKEWDAEITEQIPDQRIAWKSVGGAMNEGTVTFESLSDTKSLVQLGISYEPEGMIETVSDETGAVTLRVKKDLEQFKTYIEGRGQETGAWRGTVKKS